MTTKTSDTLNKAYANIPREVGIHFNFEILAFRGLKYYWLKLFRKAQGR